MKKMLLWFLLAGMLLSLWGCSSPEETVATTEHPRQVVTSVPSTIAETEPAALEGIPGKGCRSYCRAEVHEAAGGCEESGG